MVAGVPGRFGHSLIGKDARCQRQATRLCGLAQFFEEDAVWVRTKSTCNGRWAPCLPLARA
ncbi:hypothetical protein EMIT0P176_180072 [Pseudomonas sp. IT-P176]